jgi:Ca-activated chloride channel family protein
MLEAVSDAGNGVYSVISSIDDGENYVQTRMLQNLTYVAKDVKFQVEFNPKHVLAYRLLGYEDRNIADQDFRNDVVDAGEVGAGHRVTALYQVVLADGSIPNASKAPPIESGAAFDGQLEVSDAALVRVKVRYKDIIASEIDPAHEVYSELEPGAVLSSFAALPADARWAAGVSVVAEILKESPYRSAQELSTARSVLKDSAGTDPLRAEFLSLVNASLGSASP